MWASTTTALGEDVLEVDLSIEAQSSIRQDVDPVALVVAWRVHDRYLKHVSQSRNTAMQKDSHHHPVRSIQ